MTKKTKKPAAPLNARLLWPLLAFIALIDVMALHISGLSVALAPLLKVGAEVGILLGLSYIYTHVRPDARIANLTHISAAFFAALTVLAIFSYITVTWHQPLVDSSLVAADKAMGLDWLSFYRWVDAHPWLHKLLNVSYASILPQMTFLLLFLNYINRAERAGELVWVFIVASIGCILFSAVWPAAGAFAHFHVEENRGYVQTFLALYNGTMKVIGAEPIQGLVQFPSLHAALAIIFAYSARGIRYLFPVFIILNILLFISTAPVGGHHFADLWGGAILALVAIYTVRLAPHFNRLSNRNIALVWGLMLALALLDAFWLKIAGLSVRPSAVGATLFHILCMILLTLFYTHRRKDARIAALAHFIAVFLGFTAVTIILSYLTVDLRQPLIDAPLVAFDRALGFDWVAAHAWVAAHPLLHKILFLAYASLIPQMIVLILLLNFWEMRARCWELFWLFMGACTACLFFSALWPAAGAFGYFHVEEDNLYIQAFMQVYHGQLEIIGKDPVQGIIQFPSLHVALGIIFAYTARGIRYLFPLYIGLNVLLFISSQSIGGHHLIDLLGGAILGFFLIAAGRKIIARLRLTASKVYG